MRPAAGFTGPSIPDDAPSIGWRVSHDGGSVTPKLWEMSDMVKALEDWENSQ
jgi:hypothetical protein